MTALAQEHAEELRRRYLAHQVETATPAQRLLMLFATLLQDLQRAHEAFAEISKPGGIESIHRDLVHAQEIVLVLRGSLNGSEWTGAQPLRSVYGFVHERLVTCNLTKDPAPLPLCITLISQIRDANAKALAAELERPTAAVA